MKTNFRQRAFFSAAKKCVVTVGLTIIVAVAATAQTNTFPSTGNAGIGTTSPTLPLEIRGNAVVFSSDARALIGNYDLTTMAQGVGGGIQFGGKFHTNGTLAGFASISGIKENANDNDFSSALVFTTRANPNQQTEKMRISSSGNVGIGTTGPGYRLDVQANSQWAARFKKTDATNGGIIIESAAAYNPNIALSVNGTIKWYMNSNVSSGDALQFWESTGQIARFTLSQVGNVGIGTTAPGARLDLGANAVSNQFYVYNNGSTATYGMGATVANGLEIYTSTALNKMAFGTYNQTTFTPQMVLSGGNVGIGTTTPANKLHVAGSITVDGNINAKYQDVAEWVPSTEQLPAGTVVVLDSTRSNEVIASTQAYDTRVAGVISEKPGIALGESGNGKVLVATTGRVRVKVDASRAPIQIGDLLVTSDKAGVAMKSEPVNLGGVQIHRPGTIIGKALEPLAKGSGEILVLLSLQ